MNYYSMEKVLMNMSESSSSMTMEKLGEFRPLESDIIGGFYIEEYAVEGTIGLDLRLSREYDIFWPFMHDEILPIVEILFNRYSKDFLEFAISQDTRIVVNRSQLFLGFAITKTKSGDYKIYFTHSFFPEIINTHPQVKLIDKKLKELNILVKKREIEFLDLKNSNLLIEPNRLKLYFSKNCDFQYSEIIPMRPLNSNDYILAQNIEHKHYSLELILQIINYKCLFYNEKYGYLNEEFTVSIETDGYNFEDIYIYVPSHHY